MGIVSCESKALWEAAKKRRTTQALSFQESALLLLQNQPGKRRRIVSQISKTKAAPMEKKEMPQLQRLEKVENLQPIEEFKVLGKRQRFWDDSGDCLQKRPRQDDDVDLEKRRRIHQDQLRKRRQEEILKQRESEEQTKKRQHDDYNVLENMRKAARKALEKEELKAKASVVDHYKVFKDLGVLLKGVPSSHTYPCFYPSIAAL